MIRAVLWDVDGTLLDFLAAERAAVRTGFARHGLGECTDEMLRVYSRINVKFWEALERGEMTKPEILTGRFREFFSLYGIDPALADVFNAQYQVDLGDTVVFQPGALETVKALRGRIPQYAVTNGTKIAQRRKLARSGLDTLLDGVFISEDLGVEKPSPGFFDRVFAVLGDIPREETLIVGDSLTSDIRGGINAGLRTAWYNPEGKPLPAGWRVDHDLRSVAEVPAILQAAAMFPRRKDTLTAKNSRMA